MKIDFIIHRLSGGGAERVMVTLANGFAPKADVSLITLLKKGAVEPKDPYPLHERVKRIRLHKKIISNHTVQAWINLFRHYKSKSNRPDVIVVFLPANAMMVVPIARIFGIKVVVSEHNNHKAHPAKKLNWIRKRIYPKANAITILTSYDYDFYKDSNQHVFVMPNPINIPEGITDYSKREKNIIAAGSLKRYDVKGFDSLLHITAPLLKGQNEWRLTIAGSGDEGLRILQGIAKDLEMEQHVDFAGFCDDMQGLMQSAQVYVLPSKYEGLPMVLMEALSNGMACVAYDCVSGPKDLIVPDVNGILVEDQNQSKFRQALKSVMEDQDLRFRLAENAPNSVVSYDLPQIIAKWGELFDKIGVGR
ncbi:MAG: glycosyltransferase [Flavobacteriaceae bacterium]|nr:glycosyltransferase [Flavobacteriaceae bacterium]